MLMMGLQATFRAVARLEPEPSRLLSHLNEAMMHSAPRSRFATLCYFELDCAEHRMRWANAGHSPAPIVVRATGQTETLASGNVPLGVIDDPDYPIEGLQLEKGDFVFLCSDGVTETVGPDGKEFGIARLEQLLGYLAGKTPTEVRRSVEEQLEEHSNGTRQHDDMAIIVVQRAT